MVGVNLPLSFTAGCHRSEIARNAKTSNLVGTEHVRLGAAGNFHQPS